MKFSVKSGGRMARTLPISSRRFAAWPTSLRAGLFVLLLSLLVQGAAAQTHLHFAQQARSLAASASDRVLHLANAHTNDPAADCALCQEAAMAGAFVLPPATLLPPRPVALPWIDLAAIAEFALLAPALGWQSRAPPR
jgi:hypothetical protein